jgi:hypothetical protein
MAILAWLAVVTTGQAGWLGVRNDLGQAIIVQAVETKDQTRQTVSHRLYPGETTWEWIPTGTERKLTILDPQANRTIMVRSELTIGNLDSLHAVQAACKPCGTKVTEVRKAWEGNRQQTKKPTQAADTAFRTMKP